MENRAGVGVAAASTTRPATAAGQGLGNVYRAATWEHLAGWSLLAAVVVAVGLEWVPTPHDMAFASAVLTPPAVFAAAVAFLTPLGAIWRFTLAEKGLVVHRFLWLPRRYRWTEVTSVAAGRRGLLVHCASREILVSWATEDCPALVSAVLERAHVECAWPPPSPGRAELRSAWRPAPPGAFSVWASRPLWFHYRSEVATAIVVVLWAALAAQCARMAAAAGDEQTLAWVLRLQAALLAVGGSLPPVVGRSRVRVDEAGLTWSRGAEAGRHVRWESVRSWYCRRGTVCLNTDSGYLYLSAAGRGGRRLLATLAGRVGLSGVVGDEPSRTCQP
jgi:hypothetical protein